MPIVKCPKCKKRYDPGVDDELDEFADAPFEMSLKVVCPACGQWLRLPENEAIPAPPMPAKLLREMMAQSRLVEGDSSEPLPTKKRKRVKKRKPWWKFW